MARRRPRTRDQATAQAEVRKAIDQASRRMEADLREAFGDLADVDGSLTEAIERKGVAVAGEIVPPARMSPALMAGLAAGIAAGLQAERRVVLKRGQGAPSLPDVDSVLRRQTVPDRAQTWMLRHGATLVTAIDDSTRQAIRDVVASGIARGEHARTIAARLRNVVGVHPRNLRPIERMRVSMEAAGMPRDKIDRAVARRMARAQRMRAETIARTETVAAVHEGRMGLYDDLARVNAIDRGRMVRTWITARDERVEDMCAPLDGESVVGLDTPFPGGEEPPLHARCRCIVTIEQART